MTKMRRYATPLLAALVAASVATPAAADEIRSWTDKDGVVHFSNVRTGGGKPKRGPARFEKIGGGGVRVVLEGKDEPAAKAAAASGGADTWRPRDVSLFDQHLREACERYRIPIELARAVLASESNFNPHAVSHAGAMGLMQLMPETAVTMYVDDILDPRENIHGGVRYLRVLTNEFEGDLVKVIAAYNAGPGAVKRAGGVPNIAETQEYVKRVMRLYKEYKAQLADRT